MDISQLYEDLGNELQASKNRVRNLIGHAHWLSDGIWKEKVLIAAMRQHLPPFVQIGTGFIVSRDGLSTQIDIILYDPTRPTLFRDDDFVIITAEAVIGIIEVKTKLYAAKFAAELEKLRDNIRLVRKDGKRQSPEATIFSGLFYYESDVDFNNHAFRLDESCQDDNSVVDLICAGETFVKFWRCDLDGSRQRYCSWHCYDLGLKSAAYFIINCVHAFAPYSFTGNHKWWWPEESKENSRWSVVKSAMTALDELS